jgi:glycosyltransferase involved in cell wall biosynthesis
MRILYIHQHFSTPAGSVGNRSYEMARRLIARGHEVLMVCGSYKGAVTGLVQPFANGQRRGMVDGIEVVEIDVPYANALGFMARIGIFLRFAWRACLLALRERYDLIFTTTTPLTVAIPGILARWLRSKRFVFEVRDLWPELPKAMGVIKNPAILWAMGALEWTAYRSAHRIIGLAPGMVEGIARRGIPHARITMIPNGCDRALFDNTGEAWRPEGIPADALLAVYAGTHGPANGLNAVIDAAAELKRRGRNDIYILLIGDGKLKPALQKHAADESLSNVIFHPPVAKEKLSGLMKSTDIGLQILANIPAFYDGTSPNKFFDYLAAGIPVLVNYPGWVANLVEANACGFAVPPADAQRFADALEQAANDRAALASMSPKSRNLSLEFDRTKLADQFVDWLEGVK